MKSNKDDVFFNVMILIQTVFSVTTVSFAIGYMFEKKLLILLTIFFSMFMLILAFNNYKFFKIKFVSVFCIILALIFMFGVIL